MPLRLPDLAWTYQTLPSIQRRLNDSLRNKTSIGAPRGKARNLLIASYYCRISGPECAIRCPLIARRASRFGRPAPAADSSREAERLTRRPLRPARRQPCGGAFGAACAIAHGSILFRSRRFWPPWDRRRGGSAIMDWGNREDGPLERALRLSHSLKARRSLTAYTRSAAENSSARRRRPRPRRLLARTHR